MTTRAEKHEQLIASVMGARSAAKETLSATQAARLMIARAIVGRPSLVLIDSLLDGLPNEIAEDIISRLHARPMPWSLVVATSRSDLVDLFMEKWDLSGSIRT